MPRQICRSSCAGTGTGERDGGGLGQDNRARHRGSAHRCGGMLRGTLFAAGVVMGGKSWRAFYGWCDRIPSMKRFLVQKGCPIRATRDDRQCFSDPLVLERGGRGLVGSREKDESTLERVAEGSDAARRRWLVHVGRRCSQRERATCTALPLATATQCAGRARANSHHMRANVFFGVLREVWRVLGSGSRTCAASVVAPLRAAGGSTGSRQQCRSWRLPE